MASVRAARTLVVGRLPLLRGEIKLDELDHADGELVLPALPQLSRLEVEPHLRPGQHAGVELEGFGDLVAKARPGDMRHQAAVRGCVEQSGVIRLDEHVAAAIHRPDRTRERQLAVRVVIEASVEAHPLDSGRPHHEHVAEPSVEREVVPLDDEPSTGNPQDHHVVRHLLRPGVVDPSHEGCHAAVAQHGQGLDERGGQGLGRGRRGHSRCSSALLSATIG